MKRSTFITWDQLKVGAIILVALLILTVAVARLGEAAGLFSQRYELVAFMPAANGLREGGSVAVAGQLAGTVKRIEFLPADADTTRNLMVTVSVNRELQEQIRENSTAKLRTLGLLGDKIFDITPGTPPSAVLRPGDTLTVSPAMDYEQVIAQASEAVDDMVQLTHDLREITGGIVRGEGTFGQLLTNRTLYDELTSTLSRTNTMLARLQSSRGTFGRLLDDPTLYNQLTSTLGSVDTLLVTLTAEESTLNRLLSDTALYVNLVGITQSSDSLLGMLVNGDGFVPQMLRDQTLYDRLNKLVTDMNVILEDVRRNPRRYTKGMISVF